MSEVSERALSPESAGTAPGRGRLTGRRIVVVGAGTRPSDDPGAPFGNGRAIAVLAAREGASVACVDIDRSSAERTADLVRAEGAEATVIEADVSDEDACARLIAEAVEALGSIDGVVANIGIGLGGGLAGTTARQWDAVFDVNVRSHFLIAQAALPVLGDGSSIVLVSSIAGLKPGSRLPAYDASKAAIFGLCRHVALEGARVGVRANVVVPGLVDTPLGRLATAGRPSRGTTRVPLRREATAWDVAYAAVFLLSGESSYITAQSIVVDGGLTTIG
ncbi:MAG: oxidoreductase [Acidimicrobiales bacterium]|nr:oxidoreductase [Acidimicrobiales bacterium]